MPKNYIPLELQREIVKRAKGYCEYCLLPSAFSPNPFNFEHIIPLSKNGKSISENLAYSCGGCNAFKQDKIQNLDPLTLEHHNLYSPRLDSWSKHFDWSEDECHIIGITPIGRATVRLLKLNREGNVNLRKLLKIAGLHPPLI